MIKFLLSVVLLFCAVKPGFSQDQFKIMTYNLLEFPEAPPSNRELILNDILSHHQPDLLAVQELQSPNGADLISNAAFNYTTANMQSANFVYNTSGGNNLNQLLFYNADKFDVVVNDQISTSLRDINYYKLQLLTNNSSSTLYIHLFVAHLKASQGDFNEQWRFDMVQSFTDFLFTLPDDARVIFAGDMNFYNSNESAVQQLIIGNTPIPVFDPLDDLGDWHTNASFADLHTQSTRQSNNAFSDFGAGGGLDDRFDFIFLSDNLLDNSQPIYYETDSYKTIGNNTNCYNNNINASACFGPYDQDLRDDLYNMSDHLPVVLTMNTVDDFLAVKSYSLNDMLTLPNSNLVDQTLKIKWGNHLPEQPVIIYNTLGQNVMQFYAQGNQQSIDVSGLSKGMYYLKIFGYQDVIKFIVH